MRTVSRILLGDPACQPLPKASDPPVAITSRRTPEGLSVVARLVDHRIRSLLVDSYRDDLCDCDTQNDRLYFTIDLPSDFGTVKRVTHAPFTGQMEDAKHNRLVWAEEQWLGTRVLHLQMLFRHGSLGDSAKGAVVEFVVEEGTLEGHAESRTHI